MSLQERTDLEVVRDILDGNTDAFRTIMDRYASMIFHLVRGFERDETMAAELAHEIFLKSYERLGSFRGESMFSSWLYSLGRNHCNDYARKNIRKQKVIAEWSEAAEKEAIHADYDPEEGMIVNEFGHQLSNCLGRMTSALSEPLILRYRDGLSYEAISKELDVSVSALKVRVHRARKELKEMMEKMQ
jgi:RNA polymerase sigma-70 factor, ECF subfamily